MVISLSSITAHDNALFEKQLFIANLNDVHQQLKKINAALQQFNSPSSYTSSWKKLDKVITYLTSNSQKNSFIIHYKTASLFQKRVACEIMRTVVDTIDASIKIIKASNMFDQETKYRYMQHMIKRFFDLFACWSQQLMAYDSITYHPQWSLGYYVSKIKYFIDRKEGKPAFDTEFKKSSTFAVQAAVLGSATAFERHYPVTLEDIFMLVHQNSLTVIAALFNETLKEQSLEHILTLPPVAKKLIEKLESSSFAPNAHGLIGHRLQPKRIGLRFNQQTIEIMYNMPLRNHSSTMQIILDTQSNECYLSVQFVGNARSRWEEVLLSAALSQYISNLPLKDKIIYDYNSGIVSFNWLVSSPSQIDFIESYITLMADLSYGRKLTLKQLIPLKNCSITINQALDSVKEEYGAVGNLYLLYSY